MVVEPGKGGVHWSGIEVPDSDLPSKDFTEKSLPYEDDAIDVWSLILSQKRNPSQNAQNGDDLGGSERFLEEDDA